MPKSKDTIAALHVCATGALKPAASSAYEPASPSHAADTTKVRVTFPEASAIAEEVRF